MDEAEREARRKQTYLRDLLVNPDLRFSSPVEVHNRQHLGMQADAGQRWRTHPAVLLAVPDHPRSADCKDVSIASERVCAPAAKIEHRQYPTNDAGRTERGAQAVETTLKANFSPLSVCSATASERGLKKAHSSGKVICAWKVGCEVDEEAEEVGGWRRRASLVALRT